MWLYSYASGYSLTFSCTSCRIWQREDIEKNHEFISSNANWKALCVLSSTLFFNFNHRNMRQKKSGLKAILWDLSTALFVHFLLHNSYDAVHFFTDTLYFNGEWIGDFQNNCLLFLIKTIEEQYMNTKKSRTCLVTRIWNEVTIYNTEN